MLSSLQFNNHHFPDLQTFFLLIRSHPIGPQKQGRLGFGYLPHRWKSKLFGISPLVTFSPSYLSLKNQLPRLI